MTISQRARRQRARRLRRAAASGGGRRISLWLLLFAGLFGVMLIATGAAAATGALYGKQKYDEFIAYVAPPDELLASLPRGGARIYDRNGVLLYEFVDEFGGLRRPVPIEEISDWLIAATIATEDASFYTNNGLNVRGLARAGVENFSPFGGSEFLEGSGGSSITQQLAKNIYIPKEQRTARTVERKLREAAIALELTERYTKDQILGWYLNSISYGGIYVGIQAASEGYFGKQASELTLAEAALMAGIPQSPSLYNPLENPTAALIRQRVVLDLMVRHGLITPAEASAARGEQLVFKANRFDIEAPHFVLGRIAEEITLRFGERALYEDGLEVITTLDLGLQHEAQRILERRISDVEEDVEGHNGAFYALDTHTGQILVYVGSRDYFREDIEGRNDNVVAENSPGSTLKPFTYMSAFMQGWSTGTGILDTPVKVIDPATGAFFEPTNPGGRFVGTISAADALGNSLNIPAFKTILFAGVGDTTTVMRQVGLTTLDSPRGYGPALTLGGADITLQDLTYAYSVLANGGVMRGQEALEPHGAGERTLDPVALLRVTDAEGIVLYDFQAPVERRVVGENFVYLVTSIISDPETQCQIFGCGALELEDRPSAKKTGTSEPFENSKKIGETWTFGYTPDLVAGIWAGNSDNSPMVNIFSTTIAWKAWRDFMEYAHPYYGLEPKNFVQPPGIESRELCWPSGKLPSALCPQFYRYNGLYALDVLATHDPEELQDTWWQEIRIDSRTGLRATADTPSVSVRRAVRLVLPEEEIAEWDGIDAWAKRYGVTHLLAPSADAAGADLLQVSSPSAGARVTGSVALLGRANSPGFERYVVEWGSGTSPASWVAFAASTQAVEDGVLARWDTTQLPDGAYTLRVRLEDSELGARRFAFPLIIANGDDAPDDGAAPVARITRPTMDQVVSGNVPIDGFASSGRFEGLVIEVGAGSQPDSWSEEHSSETPATSGALTYWDTSGLSNGLYTIRLTVSDEQFGDAVATVRVRVDNSSE